MDCRLIWSDLSTIKLVNTIGQDLLHIFKNWSGCRFVKLSIFLHSTIMYISLLPSMVLRPIFPMQQEIDKLQSWIHGLQD